MPNCRKYIRLLYYLVVSIAVLVSKPLNNVFFFIGLEQNGLKLFATHQAQDFQRYSNTHTHTESTHLT